MDTAILESDPDRAEQAALDHMDFVEQSFRTGIEQQRREIIAAKRGACAIGLFL